jgi:acetylornithine/N-succinyldiaminopimelate aminotransferase
MSSQDIVARSDRHLMQTYLRAPVAFVRGEGAHLWDAEGKEYLDLFACLAVTNLGHAPKAIADAIQAQAAKLFHVSNLHYCEPQAKLAEMLCANSFADRVFLCNSGAEANEAAIKLARKRGGRGKHVVVSAWRSFHGRTLATLHATGQPEKHEVFQPLPEGFRHAAWNDADDFERVLDDQVAAILLEPVQGEGGVNPGDPEFFRAIRRMCDERGIALIVDEVQTGLGRTGEWFGFQHFDVRPDIVTMAKALGNGVPIGACWARDDVADAFKPGDHATTFGGQPLAAAAARAVLQVMEDIDAPRLAAKRGQQLCDRLLAVRGVADVRGLGLLLGVELDPGVLGERSAKDIAAACLASGLVLNGITDTALRIAPPITVSEGELDEGVGILATVLAAGAP